jgi:hypothetical protein
MSDKNTHVASAALCPRVEMNDVVDELADVADFMAMQELMFRGLRNGASDGGIDCDAFRCMARMTEEMEGRLRSCVDRLIEQ